VTGSLEVRGLCVSYGASRAVDAVDLSVGEGRAVALLGPNGAGKTSTLRALSHLVRSEYASFELFGGPVHRPTVAGLARQGLVHVPEGRHVFARLSVHENLEIGRTLAGGRPGWTTDEIYDLFPALVRLRRREGGVLSGGEQQMVAIGRGLMAAPRLLMLDEPSLGLAPRIANEVYDALGEIRGRTALLVVEQNAALALRVSDIAVVMTAGRVAWRGPADVLDHSDLASSYLGTTALHESDHPEGAGV